MPLGIVASEFSFPEVTGGTLTSDATYYYRTFTANGTLEVKYANVEMNFLLVGGGGGGSSPNYNPYWAHQGGTSFVLYGPGGAAGGYVDTQFATTLKSDMNVARSSTSYAIIIGAGGTSTYSSTGSIPSSGTETSYASIYYSRQAAGGGGPMLRNYADSNTSYSFGGTRSDIGSYGLDWYDEIYSPYQVIFTPRLSHGGGGSGAFSQGNNASNLGPGAGGASTSVYGLDVGGGSAGCFGGYLGGYDFYIGNYYGNDPSTRPAFPSGTNAGRSSTGALLCTAGVANRGGGGGSGYGYDMTSYNGGSGIAVFRYLRSQVGG